MSPLAVPAAAGKLAYWLLDAAKVRALKLARVFVGAVVSSVKLPGAAALVLPATSVRVVLVVQAPSTVSALLGMSWLMVKGPAPVAVPPWAGGRPGR
jgi:hypothetical protein